MRFSRLKAVARPSLGQTMKHIRKTVALVLALAASVPFIPNHPTRAADPTPTVGTFGGAPAGGSIMGGNGPIENEMDQPTRDAIKKGLDWLHKNLQDDNSLRGAGGQSAGIVGLAGLAFMASGSMPGDGPYGKDVDRVLDYVLKNCQPTGLVAAPSDGSPMYGHGFATLFLAEVYGMTQREDVGEKLHKAIKLIVSTQSDDPTNPKAGGWRYQPIKSDADISVTICQVMALRAARNAGVKIPLDPTINKAIMYVKASQDPDGGFMYTLGSGGSAFPRSAAGAACLFYMRSGNSFEKEIDNAIKYLKQHLPNRNDGEGHFYYGNYYATQAMFMAGGDAWKAYWPAIKKALLDRQGKGGDGSWQDGEGGGPVYSTSMALIMLQVPNRLLPILQK